MQGEAQVSIHNLKVAYEISITWSWGFTSRRFTGGRLTVRSGGCGAVWEFCRFQVACSVEEAFQSTESFFIPSWRIQIFQQPSWPLQLKPLVHTPYEIAKHDGHHIHLHIEPLGLLWYHQGTLISGQELLHVWNYCRAVNDAISAYPQERPQKNWGQRW